MTNEDTQKPEAEGQKPEAGNANQEPGNAVAPYQAKADEKPKEPEFKITDLHRKMYAGCKEQFSKETQDSIYDRGSRADAAGMNFILGYERKSTEKHFGVTERRKVVSDYIKEMLIGYDPKNEGRLDAYRKTLEAQKMAPEDIEEKMLNNMMGHAQHYLGVDSRDVMKVVSSMEEGAITKSLQKIRMNFIKDDFVNHRNETYWAKCAADDDFLFAVPKMLVGDTDFTKNFKGNADMIYGTMSQRPALENMVAAEEQRVKMMNNVGFAPVTSSIDQKAKTGTDN